MKKTSIEEFNIMLQIAKNKLYNYSESVEKEYSLALEELIKKDYNGKSKLCIGNDILNQSYGKIDKFIYENYPDSEEINVNGIMFYPPEKLINIKMQLHGREISKKLQKRYSEFQSIIIENF